MIDNWVYDLINAVQHYEDIHPKGDHCLAGVLTRVPEDVKVAAQAIADYNEREAAKLR